MSLELKGFEFSVDKRSLKELGFIPAVRVGILQDSKLMSYKRQVKSLGAGLKANKIERKQFGSETVGSTLSSVFKNTRILKEFEKLINEKGHALLSRVIGSAPSGLKSSGVKASANSFSALLKQAYVIMSKKGRNSAGRIAQKGFDQFAIGTGQTLMSIKAEVYKK